MGVREEAICIKGVSRGVREEMRLVQGPGPEHILCLPPHAAERIVHRADHRPAVEDRLRRFLSTTENLPMVRSTAAMVGWENTTTLAETRANGVRRLRWTLQPRQGGLYQVDGGAQAQNTT